MDESQRPRVLVVGAGPFQLEILRAAKQLATVVAVDGSAKAPGLALADIARVVDVLDTPTVVAVADELAVDGVVTAASDVAVPAAAAVVQARGLVGIVPSVAERCRDKLECFETLRRAGHVAPETRAVDDDDDDDDAHAEQAAAALGGFPVIVKPRSGGGGRGVTLVRDAGELPRALERARRAYGPGERAVLLQEFVAGRSVGVEAFFRGGEMIAAFVLDDQFEPGFISPAGHSLPQTLEDATAASVLAAVQRFASALGVTDGPANFDLRWVDGRAVMLEINPRLGGNSITDLVRAAYGVDLAIATVQAALGQDPRATLQRRFEQPAAARLILKHAHGRARLGDAAAAWKGHPQLLALDLLVADGEPALVRVDDWTILGRTMTTADGSANAAALAERIAGDVAARIALV